MILMIIFNGIKNKRKINLRRSNLRQIEVGKLEGILRGSKENEGTEMMENLQIYSQN